jgi:Flp pilus assembly pilin Flp
MRPLLPRLRSHGATAVEYALLVLLLGAVSVGVLLLMGSSTSDTFETVNANVESGVGLGAGNGNGPGGGNNGNGNGNGGNGCLADTAGADTIAFAALGQRNCVDITTGVSDQVDLRPATRSITVNGLARPGASRLEVLGAGQNEVVVLAGSDRNAVLSLGGGTNTIRIPGHNLSDFGFNRQGEVIVLHHQNGDVRIDLMDALSPATWSPTSYTLEFADRTLTSLDLYDMTMEMYLNNGSVVGTFRDDTFELRCDLWDSSRYHEMGDGDDTGIYLESSQRWFGGNGFDTVDLSDVWASTDATFYTVAERDVYLFFPDGNAIGFPNLKQQWDSASGDYHVERLVFSDVTLDIADVAPLFTPIVPGLFPHPPCATAPFPGPSVGHRLGGPTGPIEIDWPYGDV